MNLVFKKFIAWPMGTKTNNVMENFKQWCGLPNMHKTIDGIHIIIFKPIKFILQYYYYHRTNKYSIVFQIIVDYNKTFFGVCVGLSNNVNDSKIICCFVLCCCGQYQILFDPNKGVEGIICICWRMRDMGVNQLNNTRRNLILFHYPNSLSF
jgi:hypothetical protein